MTHTGFVPHQSGLDTVGFRPRLLDLAVVLAPATDPITVDEAKAQASIDTTDHDVLMAAMVLAATEWAEGYTRRAFVTRSLKARFSQLPFHREDLYLPLPNIVSPLTTATYEDSQGTVIPIDVSLEVEVEPTFGLVRTLPGFDWPSGVRVSTWGYDAGYGDAADVPGAVKQGVAIAAAQLFEYRTDQTVGAQLSAPQLLASKAILAPFRVFQT